jgi:hypothetical protein
MAVIVKDYNSVFVHVPKTGGSSIQKWLLDNTNSCVAKSSKHHTLNTLEEKYGKFNFSFAVVRNPWDWCVSWYYFTRDRALRRISKPKNKGKFSLEYNQQVLEDFEKGFEYFIENTNLKGQHQTTIDVSYIMKLENINTDIQLLKDKFNIKQELPYLNTSSRNKDYREYYNDNTKQIVENKFEKDIKLFGYKF